MINIIMKLALAKDLGNNHDFSMFLWDANKTYIIISEQKEIFLHNDIFDTRS